MSATIAVEHLARVEGHGGVTVELDGRSVKAVRFEIFEGARLLESLVRGRSFEDVPQILSRICAICSVAHTLTSIKATEAAFGIVPGRRTRALRDLLFRGESIESHALHLFCLALPDYLGYPSVIELARDKPDAVKLGLRLKKTGNRIQEVIGGRAVHPVNALAGGFGKLPDEDALIALRHELRAAVAEIDRVVELFAALPQAPSCRSETAYMALRPPEDYGYYAGDEITVRKNGGSRTFSAAQYRSLTNERAVPHSHAKHSFFEGEPFMVGSLARLAVNAERLQGRAAAALGELGLSLPSTDPMDNNKAQAAELIFDLERALFMVEELLQDWPGCEDRVAVRPKAGAGSAVTEAPRGLLVHSYEYDVEGRIVNADVITPTALNAASIESRLRAAAEQHAEPDAGSLTHKLEMIVRAYDPCISCSVHVMRSCV